MHIKKSKLSTKNAGCMNGNQIHMNMLSDKKILIFMNNILMNCIVRNSWQIKDLNLGYFGRLLDLNF